MIPTVAPTGLPRAPDVRLLGIAGPPGVGKSTLAALLTGDRGAVVPMDGWHRSRAELVRMGLRDRMGAPETFDAEGYAALLARIRAGEPGLRAPAFDRTIEEPVVDAVAVPATGPVLTEGNYLLLDEPRWRAVRARLDVVWHLHLDPAVRRQRLLERHVAFGKSPAEAQAWVSRVDDPNARLVEAAAGRADLVVDLTHLQR